MNVLRSFFFSLRKLVSPRASSEDLEAELQFHMDMSVEQKLAAGMSREQAEREARKEFGSDLRVKEDCRMSWGTRLVDETVQDVRRGFRRLWKRPSYSVPVVLILGLSLGACGTFTDVLFQRILRPLDYPNAGEIVQIATSHSSEMFSYTYEQPSILMQEAVLELDDTFTSIGSFTTKPVFLKIGDRSRRSFELSMDPSVWEVMAVFPLYGRAFSEDDVKSGNMNVLVSTHWFAVQHFGSAEQALGKSVFVDGESFEIIGVLGKGVHFPERCEVAFPSSYSGLSDKDKYRTRSHIICRLQPGVTLDQLELKLPVVMERVKERHAISKRHIERTKIHFKIRFYLEKYWDSHVKFSFGKLVVVLLGLALLLYLSGCLNWLTIFRTHLIREQRNMGICFGLGAPRSRIVRTILAETTLLMVVVVAMASISSLVLHGLANDLKIFEIEPLLNQNEGFGVVLSLAFFVIFLSGCFIYFYTSRSHIERYLQERQSTVSLKSKSLYVLSLIQSFTCSIIVLASVFLTQNIHSIVNTDFGFEYKNRIIGMIKFPDWKESYGTSEKLQILQRIKSQLSQVPELRENTICPSIPQTALNLYTDYWRFNPVDFPERGNLRMDRGDEVFWVDQAMVDTDCLKVMDMTLLAGRWFQPEDEYTEVVELVIDKRFAEDWFGQRNPIDFEFTTGERHKVRWKIIGVVEPVDYRGNQGKVDISDYCSFIYYRDMDFKNFFPGRFGIVCKVNDSMEEPLLKLQQLLSGIDSDIAREFHYYEDQIRAKYGTLILISNLSLGLSILTVLIASYGFFSFLFYKTQLMRKEFAIRLALGGRSSRLLRRYMVRQSIPLITGVILGMMSYYYLMGFFSDQLTNISRSQLAPYVLLLSGMVVFVFLASILPLRQMRKLELREMLQGE